MKHNDIRWKQRFENFKNDLRYSIFPALTKLYIFFETEYEND